MARVDLKMPAPVSPPVAGSQVAFRLPVGRRYHALQLRGTGTAFAPADLSEIRILLNKKIVQRFSGSDRDAMNVFDGRAQAAESAAEFTLVIPFDRYGIYTRAGEEETAINTGSTDEKGRAVTSFEVEIDIASSGPSGTLTLDMNATTSEALDGGPGTIPFLLKFVKDYASAASYELSDLPRDGASFQFLDRLFLKPSTSTLENLKVRANNYTVFERTAALNERLQRDGIRFPQNGWYVIDRTEHGYGGDPFDLRQLNDWRVLFDTGAAMTVTCYAHYLGALSD